MSHPVVKCALRGTRYKRHVLVLIKLLAQDTDKKCFCVYVCDVQTRMEGLESCESLRTNLQSPGWKEDLHVPKQGWLL